MVEIPTVFILRPIKVGVPSKSTQTLNKIPIFSNCAFDFTLSPSDIKVSFWLELAKQPRGDDEVKVLLKFLNERF